jgi:hypothetical protein
MHAAPAAVNRALSGGSRITKSAPLRQGVYVFFARAEVAVEGAFEIGLGAGEFENTVGVALEVGGRIETAVEEHPPARLVAAVALAAVERMLDRAVDESELAVELKCGPSRPRGD